MIRNDFNVEVEKVKDIGTLGRLDAALLALLSEKLKNGINLFLGWLKVENYIQNLNLVTTDKGKIDKRTLQGRI